MELKRHTQLQQLGNPIRLQREQDCQACNTRDFELVLLTKLESGLNKTGTFLIMKKSKTSPKYCFDCAKSISPQSCSKGLLGIFQNGCCHFEYYPEDHGSKVDVSKVPKLLESSKYNPGQKVLKHAQNIIK